NRANMPGAGSRTFVFGGPSNHLLKTGSQGKAIYPQVQLIGSFFLSIVRAPMILFPAIVLKDGQCVRLKLGDMNAATVFNDDPAAQARSFEAQGFQYLHVVDLNGAFAGRSVNGAAVDANLQAVDFPVEPGRGI